MKRFFYLLEYILFRFLAFGLNGLSLSSALKLADAFGAFLYKNISKRREMMLQNLQRAFPDKSQSEIEAIACRAMQTLVKITFEFIRIPKIVKSQEIEWKCEAADGIDQSKGLIYIISHFGNWELMSIPAQMKDPRPFYAIARPIKNPFVYRYIKALREKAGVLSIDKEGAARAVIKLLKQDQKICMLIDQRERQGGLQVNFFGRPAMTTSLPAMLALKYGIPVVSAFLIREAPGKFTLKIEGPFPLIRTGSYEADLLANTQQYVSRIEEEVRKRPGDWLWMHNRWRL